MQRVLRKQAKMLETKGYALRIGHLLLEEGAVTEHELAMGLATQFRLGVVDLVGRELLVGLLKDIPEAITDKYSFVPIQKDLEGVLVAVDELLPKTVIDGLKRAFEAPVHIAIVPSSQLQKVMRWCKNHRRRLMGGQLERVTLPSEYFVAEAGDPESTIKPGSITINALQSIVIPPPAAPAPAPVIDDAAPEPHPERSPEDSMNNSLSGTRAAARRARRMAERSLRLTPAPPGTPRLTPPPPGIPVPLVEPEPAAPALSVVPDPIPEEAPADMSGPTPTDFPELFDGVPEDPAAPTPPRAGGWTEVESAELGRLPTFARLLLARPATLVSILRELKHGACESLTLAPRGAGADVLAADEEGTRAIGFITPDDYPSLLDAGLELLDLDPGQALAAPVERTLQATVEGAPFDYRAIALPSQPATLVFASADRTGWRARRAVRDWAFVEPLVQRLATRRGLTVLTGDPVLVSGALSGLTAALRRRGSRPALITNSGIGRVREVTSIPVPPEHTTATVAPGALLGLCAAGVDTLAIDVSLTPEQLGAALPLAVTDAALCVGMRERTTYDALLALGRTKASPALIASLLDVVVSLHQADRLCPGCRKESVLQDAQVPPALKTAKLAGLTVYEAAGCALCDNTGVRGALLFPEIVTWDKAKATPDLFALDRKSLVKRVFELQLAQPMAVEARKALIAGTLSFKAYLKLLGLTPV